LATPGGGSGDTPAPLPATVGRIAYLGTPEVAVGPLEALVAAGFDVAVVVTGPDRRRGRGSQTSPTPVKAAAHRLGLEVHHDLTEVTRVPGGVDAGVVVAFGSIIPTTVLARVPMVNLHFSLLPRWRGAAPVQRAILAGDTETGVAVMEVVPELDAGGVLASATVPIAAHATADALASELVAVGSALLVDVLSGPLPEPQPQQGEVTYAAKITSSDLCLSGNLGAVDLERRVRVGGAWFSLGGVKVVVPAARACPGGCAGAVAPAPGEVDADSNGVFLGAADGVLELGEVRPAGRATMSATEWWRGARLGGATALDPPPSGTAPRP